MQTLLTIKDLCEKMSVPKSTMYKWVAEEKIPHIKMPNSGVRFDPIKIEQWLKIRTITVNVAGQTA